jgi:hypothetical protein
MPLDYRAYRLEAIGLYANGEDHNDGKQRRRSPQQAECGEEEVFVRFSRATMEAPPSRAKVDQYHLN